MEKMSLPAWECGLKLSGCRSAPESDASLPAWECGLKFCPFLDSLLDQPSLPAWECGLKFEFLGAKDNPQKVTPCVGVWIEIGRWALHSSRR